MPRILVFGQYVLFFWIAENGEPVHIHVGIKRAAANSTKFWLTKNGGCTLANNESKIPAKDLRDLSDSPEPKDNQYYAWIQDLVARRRTFDDLANELRCHCIVISDDASHV